MPRTYKPLSVEHKKKISDSMSGKNTWMKGRKLSEETRKRMSEARKGRQHSKEWSENISKSLKGKKTGRIPKSAFKKGNIPWCTGKKMSEEFCIKNSTSKTGENEFTGFRMPLNRRVRTTRKYYEWIEKVKFRDMHTCVLCEKNECELHAHHIVQVKDILKKEKYEEELYDLNNGITLCLDCHSGVHSI